MNSLQIQNLHLSFSVASQSREVLQGVTISLPKGQFVALVGESGSGKTQTALSVLRLLDSNAQITSGQILFTENEATLDVLKLNELDLQNLRAKKIAMIFQDPAQALNPLMTLGDQVAEVILAHESVARDRAKERVLQIFKDVGLSDVQERYDQYPHQISGGQRQRVMIAMALALKPQILIADEPTTALDVTVQAQILELIKNLRERYELTVLFVTHDLSIVAQYADFVYVMKDGHIVESGSMRHVLLAPKHDYTKNLLAAAPDRLKHLKQDSKISLTAKKLFELRGVNKKYALRAKTFFAKAQFVHVLNNINLNVYENEVLGLVGESGSGKSTLARVLLKLEDATTGEVHFDGKNITRFTDRELRLYRPHLQMIFQDPVSSLNPKMTVEKLLLEPLNVYRMGKPIERKARIQDVLMDVGLSFDLLKRYPHELSGGQCQRVAIARALLMQPKVLVADEATSALDVTVQKQILELLKSLQKKYSMTLVMISHNLDLMHNFCDRICVLYMGRIMEVLPASQIHLAAHPYTQSLLQHSLSSNPNQKKQMKLLPGEIPSLLHPPTGCVFQTRCPHYQDDCDVIVPKLESYQESAEHVLACHAPQNAANLKA